MQKFDEFINESRESHDKLQRFFHDLLLDEINNLFKNVNTYELVLDDKWMKIQYTIACSDKEEENEHRMDGDTDLHYNAGYTIKVLKHSAEVIEKSAKFFNKDPHSQKDMESSWNEGNFGMGIELSVYFTFDQIFNQFSQKIPNEIKSLLGISKFNL